MERQKLNEAAWEYHKANRYEDNPYRADIMDAFGNGASWLMTQPLADRLTDEEKEKIRAEYRQGFYPQRNLLIAIFGYDLFNTNNYGLLCL